MLERCVVAGTQGADFKNAGVQSVRIRRVVELLIGLRETFTNTFDFGCRMTQVIAAHFFFLLFGGHAVFLPVWLLSKANIIRPARRSELFCFALVYYFRIAQKLTGKREEFEFECSFVRLAFLGLIGYTTWDNGFSVRHNILFIRATGAMEVL